MRGPAIAHFATFLLSSLVKNCYLAGVVETFVNVDLTILAVQHRNAVHARTFAPVRILLVDTRRTAAATVRRAEIHLLTSRSLK